jgi:replicative DNA helicase
MNAEAIPHVVDAVAQSVFETERSLVGALLHYQDTVLIRAAAGVIGPEHFSDMTMARLFHLICKAADESLSGFPLVAHVMGGMRGDAESLSAAGWTVSALIGHCISSSVPAIGVEGAARQIKHDFLARKLKMAVQNGDTETAETSAAEMERLSKAHLTQADSYESVGAVARRMVEAMNVAHMDGKPPRDFAHCGLRDLARALGGWRAGKLYIIAGRPGMGKTTLTWSTILRTAFKGHGVMLFSLEMGRDELGEMALTDLVWRRDHRIEYRDINVSQCDQPGYSQKLEDVLEVAPVFNSLPLMIYDRGGVTLAEIRSQAMLYNQRLRGEGRRLEVLVVDHLGLIKASKTYAGNKVAETEEVSGQLKQLAKELNCAVVALAQLSRQVEGREDKRPNLSDLRWSGAIEQDADVVMFVYREEYYLKKVETEPEKERKRQDRLDQCRNKLEVLIEKQRGGPTYGVELYCDVGCSVVRDLERDHG